MRATQNVGAIIERQQRLAELETIVERGLETFVEVGRALSEIRDSRLYQESQATFEEYLDARWSMSRSYGYRLIDAAKVAELVSPMGDIPNERQARELLPVLRDEGEEAVLEVMRELRTQHGERLTAEKVRAAVDERMRREKLIGAITSSDTFEWYTPSVYIEAARQVLGGIDLDPASSAVANETVKATSFYSIDDDGLNQEWHGRIWLNPPYGRDLTHHFTEKLIEEHTAGRVTAAMLLLNGYGFDSSWFRPLWNGILCFTDHRIRFSSPLRPMGGTPFGSVFVYFGAARGEFAREFHRFGAVVERSQLVAA